MHHAVVAGTEPALPDASESVSALRASSGPYLDFFDQFRRWEDVTHNDL
jgi:hypothetical protein